MFVPLCSPATRAFAARTLARRAQSHTARQPLSVAMTHAGDVSSCMRMQVHGLNDTHTQCVHEGATAAHVGALMDMVHALNDVLYDAQYEADMPVLQHVTRVTLKACTRMASVVLAAAAVAAPLLVAWEMWRADAPPQARYMYSMARGLMITVLLVAMVAAIVAVPFVAITQRLHTYLRTRVLLLLSASLASVDGQLHVGGDAIAPRSRPRASSTLVAAADALGSDDPLAADGAGVQAICVVAVSDTTATHGPIIRAGDVGVLFTNARPRDSTLIAMTCGARLCIYSPCTMVDVPCVWAAAQPTPADVSPPFPRLDAHMLEYDVDAFMWAVNMQYMAALHARVPLHVLAATSILRPEDLIRAADALLTCTLSIHAHWYFVLNGLKRVLLDPRARPSLQLKRAWLPIHQPMPSALRCCMTRVEYGTLCAHMNDALAREYARVHEQSSGLHRLARVIASPFVVLAVPLAATILAALATFVRAPLWVSALCAAMSSGVLAVRAGSGPEVTPRDVADCTHTLEAAVAEWNRTRLPQSAYFCDVVRAPYALMQGVALRIVMRRLPPLEGAASMHPEREHERESAALLSSEGAKVEQSEWARAAMPGASSSESEAAAV